LHIGYDLILGQVGYDNDLPRSQLPNSLFKCSDSDEYPGYLKFREYCGPNKCIHGGSGKDDYCI
jgi:hypothetical protein